MKKYQIRIDTLTDVAEFCELMNKKEFINQTFQLTDGAKKNINAKSQLGVMYASSDFKEIYLISEEEMFDIISKFII